MWGHVDRRALLAFAAGALASRTAWGVEADTFRAALQAVRSTALAGGIAASTIDQAFAGLAPDPTVIALSQAQAEFSRPISAYVEGAVSPARLSRGRVVASRWADVLRLVQARYGVPPGIVLALWAMESEYGGSTGGFDTIRSLATLAAFGKRTDLFRTELVAALRILDGGRVPRTRLTGSWAGAMGETQFTPSSYLRFAIDTDGDGIADIWRSKPDVIASIANFLRENGWQADRSWGHEVMVPSGADLSVHRRTFPDWVSLGVTRADHGTLPTAGDGSLFFPAGIAGPVFLLTGNWEVIRAYNTSDAYALAVGRLADRLDGAGPLTRPWPTAPVLTLPERQEVHRRLAELGLYAGTPDGKFGAQTRESVRRFQVAHGLAPDGYADAALLRLLRAR